MTGKQVESQQQPRHGSPFAAHEQGGGGGTGEELRRTRTGMSVSDLLSGSSRRDTARSSLSDGPSNDNDDHSPHTDDGRTSSRMTLSRASSSAVLARGDTAPTRAMTPVSTEQQAVEGVTAYQYAAVQQITEERENIEYILTIREQPKHSRMCGVGEKADRRPIDPAPIIQLRVVTHEHPNPFPMAKPTSVDDAERPSSGPATAPPSEARNGNAISATSPSDGAASSRRNLNARRGVPVRTDWGEGWENKTWYLENPYYFMYAMLADAETDEELHLLSDGKTRFTTGSCVSCLYHLKDIDGTEQGFFVFPDLSIRVEGRYRLKLCLFETLGHEVHHCKSVYSKPFNVYTAKRFPGMEESTLLSKSFADQGLKVRVRKNPRARRTRGAAGKRKDAVDSDEDSEGGGTHRDQRPMMMMDSAASSAAGNKRMKGDMPMYGEQVSASHGVPPRHVGGGDFAYDAYAAAPLPRLQQHPGNAQYGHAHAGRQTGSYSPEERRDGPTMEYYNGRATQAHPHGRTHMAPMEEGVSMHQQQQRHGPPPPPSQSGYVDAAEMDARRGIHRHPAASDEQHPFHHHHHHLPQRLPQGRPPPPPSMMHSDAHAANIVAAEREAYNREREREAVAYHEQQMAMRDRHPRSSMPVGPPPPAPPHYDDPAGQQRGSVNAYDPRFGSAPLPPAASSLAASSRDRSISDPYLTRDAHRLTSNGATDARDAYAAEQQQHDGRRHRLPPLHVALSPDTSPRVQRGPAQSRPRSAQQPGAAFNGGFSGPEYVAQSQQGLPPHADRRHPQQQHYGGGGGAHDGGRGMMTSPIPPPPAPQYFGTPVGGMARMPPPPPHAVKESVVARNQPPPPPSSSYHAGARTTQYGGGR